MVISGQDQVGPPGEMLPDPLVVRVTDQAGNPIFDQVVNFVVTSGGGSAFAEVARTDANGLAQDYWTLGPEPGPNTLEARAVDANTGEKLLFGSFRATAVLAVATVEVTPATSSITVGDTVHLTATTKDADGNVLTGRGVTWSTSNASVATVSASGDVAAVGSGSAVITATSEGKTGTATVTVQATVATVAVTPASSTVQVGGTVQLTATLRDANGNILTGRPVSWSTSNANVATVSASGQVTGASAGSVTITATSEGKSGTATVTVQNIPVATVEVSPASATISAGGTIQLMATPRDANGNTLSGRTVAWSTSNANVATVSASGNVTTTSVGSVVITATSEGKSGNATITVQEPVATVVVTPSNTAMMIGATLQLTATAQDANGKVLSGREVSWRTADPSVATVSATGLVSAIDLGTTTITAVVEGQTGSASVTVREPVATVEVTPANSIRNVGGAVQLTATLKDQNGSILTGRPVTWSSSDEAVASVSATGKVSALSVGSVVITATSEGKSGTATVTVREPVATVEVTPESSTIAVGETVQLMATPKDADGNVLTGRAIAWSTSNANVATVTSLGKVTAVSDGSVVITATSGGKSGTASVTVVSAEPVATVTVTPGSSTITVGGSVQLTATLRDGDGNVLTGRSVAWSTSNANVATVSASGNVTAAAEGSVTITATSEGKSGTASVTVQPPPVHMVTVTPASSTITVGGDVQLTATLTDADGNVLTGRTVSWSTSNPNVATVSASGNVIAAAEGSAVITATSEGKSGTATVTVEPVPVATVTVTPANSTRNVGGAVQLTATIKDANGNVLTGRTVTWSTSDANVATVSATGRVTAVSPGSVTITATSEGKSGTATVTVREPVATVEVTPASSTIAVGGTLQLTATTRDANGNILTGRAVTWSTSNANVATVTASGNVTAVAEGSVTITATSEGKSGTASVTVQPPPVATVTVTPAAPTITVGSTVQLTATLRDTNGNILTGRSVTWSTSNANVATVSPSGLVSGAAVGSVTITATSEGKSGTATVTVQPPPVATVTVTPAAPTITVGNTVQLTATLRDANGNVLTGRSVAWSTSNANVATVSTSGLVSGAAVGSVTITATSEGKSGTATVTVQPPPVATVTVTPAAPTITVGNTVQLTATLRDANGNILTGRSVTWSTSNANVATVSTSGLVSGAAAGSAVITATSEGKSGTASVTVQPPPVATVTVTPASSTIYVGQTVQLTATLRDANGNVLTGRTVTWSTSNANVATVSSTGRVTAANAGSATITATSEGKSGTASVTVRAPVASVEVTPLASVLLPGQTVQLTVTLRDADGNVLTGRTVTWSTSAPAVATVSATGLVTAVGAGVATITATSEGVSGTATITVGPAPPLMRKGSSTDGMMKTPR